MVLLELSFALEAKNLAGKLTDGERGRRPITQLLVSFARNAFCNDVNADVSIPNRYSNSHREVFFGIAKVQVTLNTWKHLVASVIENVHLTIILADHQVSSENRNGREKQLIAEL